jgi:hypothetical protein
MIPRRFIPAEFNVCLAVLVFSLPVHLFSRFAVGHLLYSFSTTTPSDTPTLDLPTRTTFSKRLIAKFFHGSSFVPVFGCRADRLADLRLSEGVEIRRCIKRGFCRRGDRPARHRCTPALPAFFRCTVCPNERVCTRPQLYGGDREFVTWELLTITEPPINTPQRTKVIWLEIQINRSRNRLRCQLFSSAMECFALRWQCFPF